MLRWIAKTISNITNPTILSIVILLIISFTESASLSLAIGQSAVLIGLLVVFPLAYVFFRTASQTDKKTYRRDPTLFLKRHPIDIIILGIICGPSLWVILKFLSAPVAILETLIALSGAAFIIAIINLFYRASFHLAGITTLVYMIVVTWGTFFLFLLLLLPIIGWAKYTLHDHDYRQMILGSGLGAAITALTLRLF